MFMFKELESKNVCLFGLKSHFFTVNILNSRKSTGGIDTDIDDSVNPSKPGQCANTNNTWTLELTHRTGMRPSSMSLITPLLFLLWHAKISAVKKACVIFFPTPRCYSTNKKNWVRHEKKTWLAHSLYSTTGEVPSCAGAILFRIRPPSCSCPLPNRPAVRTCGLHKSWIFYEERDHLECGWRIRISGPYLKYHSVRWKWKPWIINQCCSASRPCVHNEKTSIISPII